MAIWIYLLSTIFLNWLLKNQKNRSRPSSSKGPLRIFFGPNIAAIVAPTVTLGVLAIVLAVLGWLFCVVKKKRQTEGTYRPSAEEQSGAWSVAAPDALKLPKEERLI
uniref:Crumbs homolog 3b n=1 Tax=Echeneis naucrates TaxID=173247 RepID=A0A665VFX1_ECHNA